MLYGRGDGYVVEEYEIAESFLQGPDWYAIAKYFKFVVRDILTIYQLFRDSSLENLNILIKILKSLGSRLQSNHIKIPQKL